MFAFTLFRCNKSILNYITILTTKCPNRTHDELRWGNLLDVISDITQTFLRSVSIFHVSCVPNADNIKTESHFYGFWITVILRVDQRTT